MLDYKLFENLQTAKKILASKGISEDNENFIKLKDLLRNNINYLGVFTKWLANGEPFDKLKSTFIELKTSNIKLELSELEKFETSEKLYDYVTAFVINRTVNSVIKELPSQAQALVTDKLKKLISLNAQYAKSIKHFFGTKGGKFTKTKDSEGLYKDTYQLIENLKGEFNLKTMLKELEGLNVEVVEATDFLLAAKIFDFTASKKLGSVHWCISTNKSQWDSYVSPFVHQYFIWDFTKTRADIHHMIGLTYNVSNNFSAAHWADDSPLTNEEKEAVMDM